MQTLEILGQIRALYDQLGHCSLYPTLFITEVYKNPQHDNLTRGNVQKLEMANNYCHARLLTWFHIPTPPPELGFAPMSPWTLPGLRPFITPGPAFCFIWARLLSHWAGFWRLNWVIFRGCFCEINYNWVHTHSSLREACGHCHYAIQ
jgi:hypothetical protein